MSPGAGAIDLAEGGEQVIGQVGWDAAAGILDFEADDSLVGRLGKDSGAEHNFSVVREFDGVSEEIEEDLSDPRGVSREARGNLGRGVTDQLDVFAERALGEQEGGALDQFSKVKGFGLDLEFSGFDFREIEDVVDDPQKRFGRILDRGGE